jgi:hypothetical protein
MQQLIVEQESSPLNPILVQRVETRIWHISRRALSHGDFFGHQLQTSNLRAAGIAKKTTRTACFCLIRHDR